MMSIKVESRDLERALQQLGAKAADGRKPLGAFYLEFKARCLRAWGQVRIHGGTFRGIKWPGMKDQYTRKTDGVTVPPEGNVPRVARGFRKATKWTDKLRRNVSTGERMSRVSGNVSGKLRKSGQRVKAGDVLLKDTGELQQRLFPQRPDVNGQRLIIGGDAPDHYEYVAEKRPVLFFLPEDQAELERQADIYLGELAKEFNGA